MSEKIKDSLIKKNLITPEKLEEAQAEQKKSGEPLGQILLRKGFIREEDLTRALAEQYNIPFVRFGKFLISKEVLEKVPAKLAVYYKMVPIRASHDVLTVAIADPKDIRVLDDIRESIDELRYYRKKVFVAHPKSH